MADETKPAKEKKAVDVSKIQPKPEYKNYTGVIHSPFLERPVDFENVKARPALYLKKEARRHVLENGAGVYPLLSKFEVGAEEIEALSKL